MESNITQETWLVDVSRLSSLDTYRVAVYVAHKAQKPIYLATSGQRFAITDKDGWGIERIELDVTSPGANRCNKVRRIITDFKEMHRIRKNLSK